MNYDFDKGINRKGTNSIKWDFNDEMFGNKNILPMWIADMDFQSPQPVIDAIKKRARHGVYGYTDISNGFYKSIIDWMDIRHNWRIEKDWILQTQGVVPSLAISILAFTKPGEKIIIQSPVYSPFFTVVRENGRQLIVNRLKIENGKYQMDFEDLKCKIDSHVKMLMLCNPHNPVGRVWSKEELEKLGKICLENNILIVSDEIHSDIIYKNHKHISIASLSEELANNTITLIAPSKTFNIAGLTTSIVIITNKKLYDDFKNRKEGLGFMLCNIFGLVALEASYKYGEEWLEQLLSYLEENVEYVINYFKERIVKVKAIEPEGTYLMWLDFRNLNLSNERLKKLIVKKARVGLSDGILFGPGGEGFQRISIACPRSLLEEGLGRIERALNG